MNLLKAIRLTFWLKRTGVLCLFLIFGASSCLPLKAQTQKDLELLQAFKKMDEAANGFRTFSAKFSQKTYTAILDVFDSPQTGKYYYSFGEDKKALWRHETINPAVKILTVKQGIATVYQPKIKEAMIYNLGKRREYLDYLAIGIGRSSAEIREKFQISLLGSESISGVPCYVLLCKPKDKEVSSKISSIAIWLKKASGTPVQFKIEAPSEDYLLETFSDEKLNATIPDSMFDQKLPDGVSILRIQ